MVGPRPPRRPRHRQLGRPHGRALPGRKDRRRLGRNRSGRCGGRLRDASGHRQQRQRQDVLDSRGVPERRRRKTNFFSASFGRTTLPSGCRRSRRTTLSVPAWTRRAATGGDVERRPLKVGTGPYTSARVARAHRGRNGLSIYGISNSRSPRSCSAADPGAAGHYPCCFSQAFAFASISGSVAGALLRTLLAPRGRAPCRARDRLASETGARPSLNQMSATSASPEGARTRVARQRRDRLLGTMETDEIPLDVAERGRSEPPWGPFCDFVDRHRRAALLERGGQVPARAGRCHGARGRTRRARTACAGRPLPSRVARRALPPGVFARSRPRRR